MSQQATENPQGPTRRSQVARKILALICTGRFKGGDRLVEAELAQEIGVSRTPVREALSELASIGIIDLKPNRGAIVRPFGPVQVREIYHVRKVLEAEATRMCQDRIDRDQLKDIRAKTQDSLNANSRGAAWQSDAMELDQRFHELIRITCGSERLAEEIVRYRTLVQSVREAVGNNSNAQDLALIEHTLIIDLLLDRQGARAAEAMAQHIDRAAALAAEALGAQ